MIQLEIVENRYSDIKKVEEYLNTVRTNIQFSGPGIKTIVLTSVQPGEGKSTLAVSLATSFAQTGYRTLLIDADTRNSVLTGTFKANRLTKGLTAFLSGNAELSEVVCSSSIENLSVILAGKTPPNPTNLLQNKNFISLMKVVHDLFDYVIIDTPPIGLVIDAAIIAKNCDASILVTEAGATKRKFLQRAKEQMVQSGSQFLGVIFNKDNVESSSYGSYGQYGQYGNTKKKKK